MIVKWIVIMAKNEIMVKKDTAKLKSDHLGPGTYQSAAVLAQ